MTAPGPGRYRAGRRGWHGPPVVACALLALAVVLALTATVAGRASAAPADGVLAVRARTLQAELDRRHDTIERFTERVNATKEHRRQLGDPTAGG